MLQTISSLSYTGSITLGGLEVYKVTRRAHGIDLDGIDDGTCEGQAAGMNKTSFSSEYLADT